MSTGTLDEYVDYYALLQVSETASTDEITKAIREARRIWTKRQAASNPERRQEAELKVKQITDAERVLKDKTRRADFDRRRADWRPATPELTGSDTQRDWAALAKQYLQGGNAHSANYAAREALALKGDDHASWWVRAHSSFLMGKPADSVYEFNEAIRLQPQNPEYHFDLGEAFAALNQWQNALKEYEGALSIEPGNPLYKTAIANVYLVNNQPARALELMEEVVKASPDVEFFRYYLAWAIHDDTVRHWSKLKNGKYAITSEAQIDFTIKASKRALSFKFDDDQLRAGLQENLRIAENAQQKKWRHSSNMAAYAVAHFIGICMFAAIAKVPVVGILGLAWEVFVSWTYVNRHFKPNWKHVADSGTIATPGI